MYDMNKAFSLMKRINEDPFELLRYFQGVINETYGSVRSGTVEEYDKDYFVVGISTGGWSDNESAMDEAFQNFGIAQFWYSSTRGGHYEFRVAKKSTE